MSDCVADKGLISLFWVAVGSYWVVLATIGPRTTQELFFPIQAVNRLFDCVYAVVGLWTCWSRDEGLVCLINLVRLGTTQIELEGWFSSPQPLNSTGIEVRA